MHLKNNVHDACQRNQSNIYPEYEFYVLHAQKSLGTSCIKINVLWIDWIKCSLNWIEFSIGTEMEMWTNNSVLNRQVKLKGYSEIIAVTTPSIFMKSKIFAFW